MNPADADSESPRFLGCRLDPPPHYRVPAELRHPILFEEPEVHWVAMMVDSGHEDTEAFRAAILDSLRPHLDDGEHITEMWAKVEQMNDAEAVRLMGEVGRLRQGFHHTSQ